MVFNFKIKEIFWDIPKWSRGQTNSNGGYILIPQLKFSWSVLSPTYMTPQKCKSKCALLELGKISEFS